MIHPPMPRNKLKEEELKLQQKQLDLQMQNGQLFKDALEQGLPLLDKYLTAKINQVEGPKIRWSIISFASVLVLVVALSGFLVYDGKLDASNFTFLLGTLIGAVITLLGDILIPSQQ